MGNPKRAGQVFLFGGGLMLLTVMAITLLWEHRQGAFGRRQVPLLQAVVFLPDRADWLDFHQGVSSCAHRGLVRVVRDEADLVEVQTPQRRRTIQFRWNMVRGVLETRKEVRLITGSSTPPLAIIGSINTAITATLAAELGAAARSQPATPVLLVPWASSILARSSPTGQNTPLLELDPGRTFRFCLNNRRAADLVTSCVAESEPNARPGTVFLVSDRTDPFSTDLAGCFRSSILARAPSATIIDQPLTSPSAPESAPSNASDKSWAEGIWKRAIESEPKRPVWVVLPLQADPTRRLLQALRTAARTAQTPDLGPLRVLCGDAIGVDLLSELAGTSALAVWCASSDSAPSPGLDLRHDAQVPAEVVASLARLVDAEASVPTPAILARRLASQDLTANDPSAMGRSLQFEPSGERRDDTLGHVLSIRPRRGDIFAHVPGGDGRWQEPIPLAPTVVEARQ